MPDPDCVDPVDAMLHQAFGSMVEHISDPAGRDAVTDFLMTARPLAEWSKEELDTLRDICDHVISRLRSDGAPEQLTGPDAPDGAAERR